MKDWLSTQQIHATTFEPQAHTGFAPDASHTKVEVLHTHLTSHGWHLLQS
jgi:hypothetical protein